jgi:hypothetical protein
LHIVSHSPYLILVLPSDRVFAIFSGMLLSSVHNTLILLLWPQHILGGPRIAEDLYNCAFYDEFRTVSLITSAIKFAREGNCKAVEIMFMYHGDALQPHWLPVLSNFPETMDPNEYESLLPECTAEGNVFPWIEVQLRAQDWCEEAGFQ